jgi:trimeric autotransporter adhesin
MAYQPKSYRKFLAGSVSAALVASAIGPVAANAAGFSDVSEDSVHYEGIMALTEKGLLKGYEDGTFKPAQKITRGQVAKIMARLIEGEGELEQVFDDVPVTADEELVRAAHEVFNAGVFTGNNGNLKPADNITRQQMAKVLVEAFDLEHSDKYENNLTDLDTAYEEYREYIQILVENGITQVADGKFRPLEHVSRAQFATFVYRILNATAEEEVTAADIEAVTFVDENTLEVTFNGTLTEVNKEDFSIEGVEIESVEIKASAAEEAAKTVVVIKTKTKLEEGKSYTVAYKGETTDKTKVEVPVVAPKVESVSAINNIQIVVTFNKKVTEETATNLSNYTLQGVALNGNDKAELSEDGKSVTLTLTSIPALTNGNAYSLVIDGIKDESGKEIEKYTTSILANDTTKPSVETVSAKAGTTGTNTVKVKFSEPIKTAGAFYVNGYAATVSPLSTTDYALNNEVTLTTSQKLEAGKTYTLLVESVTDHGNNVLASTEVSFTVESDTTKGNFVSSTVLGEDKVKLTFDKEIDTNTIPADTTSNNFSIDKVGGTFNGTAAIDPEDSKSVIVTITNPGYSDSVKSINPIISLSGLKDIYGNEIAAVENLQVTLNQDVQKPQLVKATVSEDKKSVVLEMNEEIDSITVTAADANAITVVNSDGVDVTNTLFVNDNPFDVAQTVDKDGTPTANTKYIKLSNSGANTIKPGTYTVTLPAGAFADTSIAGNTTDTIQFTFTVSETVNDTPITIANPANETVNADGTFSFTLGLGTTANSTALNTSNYTIDGKALPTGTNIVFTSTAKDEVKITIPAGTFDEDAVKTLAVFNLENSAGKKMTNTVLRSLNVKDNTNPTIVSAKATADDTLVLTFSEPVSTVDVSGDAELVLGSYEVDLGTATVQIVGKTVTITQAGIGAVDLSNTKLSVVEGAFADTNNNTNPIKAVDTITVEDNFVDVTGAEVAVTDNDNGNNNITEISVNITAPTNAAVDKVKEYDIYIVPATVADLTTVADVESTLTKLATFDASQAGAAVALPLTAGTKLSDGTNVTTLNGDVDVYIVVKDELGNKALVKDVTNVETINIAD